MRSTYPSLYLSRYPDIAYLTIRACGESELSLIIAEQYARVLAIKDEYEVARLLTSGSFREELSAKFEAGYSLSFHLAPPIIASPRDIHGNPKKINFGVWITPVLSALAKSRRIRNTFLDPFRYTAERRTNLALLQAYESFLDVTTESLSRDKHAVLMTMAAAPGKVRGYGVQRQRAAKACMALLTQPL